MSRINEKNQTTNTIANPKSVERVWVNGSFTMVDLPKGLRMQDAWRMPRYILKVYGEDLVDLVKRASVFCPKPVQFEQTPEAIADILSGKNESWRIYNVRFTEDAGWIYFDLVLKAVMYGHERYQMTELGLGFSDVPDMVIKATTETEDGSE